MRFSFERALPSVLVRVTRPTGECVLQRRVDTDGAAVYELVLNGKLLMDSAEHVSEEALADLGLRACGDRAELEVLVGGLGFGFTLGAVLRDPRVTRAVVVELEPLLVSVLARPDVRSELAVADLEDPRVEVRMGNVRAAIDAAERAHDLILLDVDNGPESLSAVGNQDLYAEEGLRRCAAALRPGGVLAIWSSDRDFGHAPTPKIRSAEPVAQPIDLPTVFAAQIDSSSDWPKSLSEPAPECLARLQACFADVREWIVPVERGARRIDYRILTARAP